VRGEGRRFNLLLVNSLGAARAEMCCPGSMDMFTGASGYVGLHGIVGMALGIAAGIVPMP
jgi:hypothetical protein